MSLHDDPSILTIPVTTKFPTTDYGTKLLLARNWVRKRHPDGPVSVYTKRRGTPEVLTDPDWRNVRRLRP